MTEIVFVAETIVPMWKIVAGSFMILFNITFILLNTAKVLTPILINRLIAISFHIAFMIVGILVVVGLF